MARPHGPPRHNMSIECCRRTGGGFPDREPPASAVRCSASLSVCRTARNAKVKRLVLAHIGRPTIRSLDSGWRPDFGELGEAEGAHLRRGIEALGRADGGPPARVRAFRGMIHRASTTGGGKPYPRRYVGRLRQWQAADGTARLPGRRRGARPSNGLLPEQAVRRTPNRSRPV